MDIAELRKRSEIALAKAKKDHPIGFEFYSSQLQGSQRHDPRQIMPNSRKPLLRKINKLENKELVHLLKRSLTGVTKVDINHFKDMDLDAIMDELFTPSPLPLPVNDYNTDDVVDPDVPLGEPIHDVDYNDDVEFTRLLSLKTWMIDQFLRPTRSIHSKLWLFWTNHLVVEVFGVFVTRFNYKYLKLLHDYSFGNFKELIKEITVNQSMLIYLNGHYNVKDAPDENYARELQELFCLGKGPNSNYTEQDVQAAARVLTGWKVNWGADASTFNKNHHDTGDKEFSSFYNNHIIKGKDGEDGASETDELIAMIFEQNEASKFICRELYRFFVYTHIDEWTEKNIISELADVLVNNDYNIGMVLRTLLSSEHFFDSMNYGAMIKSPVDFLLGFWRTGDVSYEVPEDDIVTRAYVRRSMYWNMFDLGQAITDPPNVAGFPAYYQFPNYDRSWITTNSITRRAQISDGLIYYGFWSKFVVAKFHALPFIESLNHPEDPNSLIDEMCDLFLGLDPDDSVKASLKSTLLSGQTSDYYWTDAWNIYLADKNNEENKMIVLSRLYYMAQRFFQLAEFHLT